MNANELLSLLPLLIVLGGVIWAVRVALRSKVKLHSSVAEFSPSPAKSTSWGRGFELLCWAVTLLLCTLGALRLFDLALSRSASAPQYAAEAAGVCAMVIVPYVFSRAVQGWRRSAL